MKTIRRIVQNETFSAYILIPIALLAIALGAHFDAHFLEQARQIAGWHFTIREFTLDYLLGFFFYSVWPPQLFSFISTTESTAPRPLVGESRWPLICLSF